MTIMLYDFLPRACITMGPHGDIQRLKADPRFEKVEDQAMAISNHTDKKGDKMCGLVAYFLI